MATLYRKVSLIFFDFESKINKTKEIDMGYINVFNKKQKSFLTGSWCEPDWIYNGVNELGECTI